MDWLWLVLAVLPMQQQNSIVEALTLGSCPLSNQLQRSIEQLDYVRGNESSISDNMIGITDTGNVWVALEKASSFTCSGIDCNSLTWGNNINETGIEPIDTLFSSLNIQSGHECHSVTLNSGGSSLQSDSCGSTNDVLCEVPCFGGKMKAEIKLPTQNNYLFSAINLPCF